jgi:multimeric flavodoxin WrbA
MTVLGISGSTRKDGNTSILVRAVLDRCEKAGLTTEFISLAGKKINPCLGCEKCKEQDWCIVQNDDWGEIMQKVIDAEVLVIGSPTYYYDVCGHIKKFHGPKFLSLSPSKTCRKKSCCCFGVLE